MQNVPTADGARTATQAEINLEHYGRPTPGRADYWRLMAAPRFRTLTILDVIKEANPRTILDVGCGDGTLLSAIHGVLPQAKLAGVDLAEAQLVLNRQTKPEIEWFVGLAEDVHRVTGKQFDLIVASELIEHLEDPGLFLRNLLDVCAPGGILVLSTQSGKVNYTERYVGHLRHFSTAEMRQFLVDAGWEPVKVWNAGFPFQNLSKYLANLAPNYTLRQFGEKPYGAFEKFVAWSLRVLFRLNSQTRGAQLFAVSRRPAH